MAVTDPAALVARMPRRAVPEGARWKYAFMPHWQSEAEDWADVCEAAGVAFIDPRWPTARVLAALDRTGVLLTEAMHGAIVADALRIPWIPVRTRQAIKPFKWEDWCQSMELEYRPHSVSPIWPRPLALGRVGRLRRWARLRLIAR